ncbi:MAG TPA: hypothetical protein VLA78_02805 [Paracoccaceae bacterium]|nr:hypothetical protein [Paracoccaceae bacterium]
MNSFIIKGVAKDARTNTVGIEYDKGALRNTDPVKVENAQKSFKWKAKTLMGDTSMELVGSMQTRIYEVGNPDGGGKPDLIYDVKNARVFATDLVLPSGYSMTATPTPKRVQERKSGNATYPVFDIEVLIEVGPMIGTWTKYKLTMVFDALKGTIKY